MLTDHASHTNKSLLYVAYESLIRKDTSYLSLIDTAAQEANSVKLISLVFHIA